MWSLWFQIRNSYSGKTDIKFIKRIVTIIDSVNLSLGLPLLFSMVQQLMCFGIKNF